MTMHLPMPAPRPEKDAWVHDPAKGLAWLKATIAGHLGALREREARLSREFDEPERAEAASRALVLDGPDGANLLRYERMHDLSFHRAYGAFVKGRKEAAATGVPPGAPIEADEADEIDAGPARELTSIADPGPVRAPAAGTPREPSGEVSARPKSLAQAVARNEAKPAGPECASGSRSVGSCGTTGDVEGPGAGPDSGPAGDGPAVAAADGAPPVADA
jgi:hypothetical protein